MIDDRAQRRRRSAGRGKGRAARRGARRAIGAARPAAPPVALIAAALLLSCAFRGGGGRPNIILITIDTLRADHLTPYGYHRRTSPFLKQLSGEAVVFRDAVSQCGTTPQSLSSLMTGLFPFTDEIFRSNGPFVFLKRSTVTLAAWLGERGYRTHAITSSIQSAKVTGVDLGFQSFDGIRVEDDPGSSRRRTAAEMSQLAAEWIAENAAGKKPFFLWLHYLDPHHPYDPPERFDSLFKDEELSEEGAVRRYVFDEMQSTDYPLSEKELRHLQLSYDREIVFTDEALRALLESRLGGALDRSLLIVTADHGESLGEHRIITHNNLYHSIVHVPLLIRLPGGRRGGIEVDDPVMLVDVFPTVADLLDDPDPPTGRGLSLLPAIEGGETAPLRERIRIAEYGRPAIYGGSLKLIERVNGAELYDLADDPGELRNLGRSFPGRGESLRARYAGLKSRGPGAPLPDSTALPAVTDEMRRELEALGYVDK